MRKVDSKVINNIFIDSGYNKKDILISHNHLYEFGIGHRGLSIMNLLNPIDGVDGYGY
jgi:hypothetical protein